jgi:beta-fructofuranosidase
LKINRRKFLSSTAIAAAAAALHSRIAEAFAANPVTNLAFDPRRPQFHLLPARNWMNDPNGPIFWKGHYHMFFQYNPNGAVWGDMHWAHAISPDMIHWTHLPIALAPTPGSADADGCFSGTAVVHNGVPTFIYTGVAKAAYEQATLRDGNNNLRETQLYATSTDPQLRTWTKHPTPIITAPPKDMPVTGFRDPAPWREPSLANGAWLMAVGSGTKEKGGAILLYKSSDLQAWEYLHIVAGSSKAGTGDATNPVDSGDMWECPDLFPLGNKHVLIYSTQGKVFWKTGELDAKDLIFHEEQSGLLDHGSFYAPKTQLDKTGNRTLWGWIPETRPVAEYSAAGWAGLMSLPRVLTLGEDGRLRIAVAPAVEKLRKHEQKVHLEPVKGGAPESKEMLSDLRLKDACGELLCTVRPTEPFSIDLLTPVDPKDANAVASQVSYISIRYSQANPKELVVDQQRLQIGLTAGEPLELRFFIDGSVIELFVNNQATCTKRFYYPGPTAPAIAVSVTGKASDISRLSLWQLSPISKDRLTS